MTAPYAISHYSDRVLQAQGMISVQAHCSLERALALLENTALMTDTTAEEVADVVLDGRARFDPYTEHARACTRGPGAKSA